MEAQQAKVGTHIHVVFREYDAINHGTQRLKADPQQAWEVAAQQAKATLPSGTRVWQNRIKGQWVEVGDCRLCGQAVLSIASVLAGRVPADSGSVCMPQSKSPAYDMRTGAVAISTIMYACTLERRRGHTLHPQALNTSLWMCAGSSAGAGGQGQGGSVPGSPAGDNSIQVARQRCPAAGAGTRRVSPGQHFGRVWGSGYIALCRLSQQQRTGAGHTMQLRRLVYSHQRSARAGCVCSDTCWQHSPCCASACATPPSSVCLVVSGPRASASGHQLLDLRQFSLGMKLHAHTMACCPTQTGWCFCSIMQLVTNVSILCALPRIIPQSLDAEEHLLGRRLRQTHCRRITRQPMQGLRTRIAPPSRCSTP